MERFGFENNSEFSTWRMAPPGKFLLFIMFFEFSCGADCEMAPRKTLPTDYSLRLPLLGVSEHMALALFNVSIQLVNSSLSSIGGPHTGLARTVLLSWKIAFHALELMTRNWWQNWSVGWWRSALLQ